MELNISKYYIPGLGYSPSSGPSVGGGFGVDYSPEIWSSTFFGSDVKGLLPIQRCFGRKRSGKRSGKSNKRSGKRSNKRSNKKSNKRSGKRSNKKIGRR